MKIFNVLENRKMTLSVRMTGLFVDMMRTAQVSTTTLSKKKKSPRRSRKYSKRINAAQCDELTTFKFFKRNKTTRSPLP